MIYLYYGDDTDVRKEKITDLVRDLSSEHETLVAQFDESNWAPHAILSYTESAGLFDTTYVVVIDRVFDDKEKIAFILENISRFSSSKNHFIFSEMRATKEMLKPFEKVRASIEKIEVKVKNKIIAPSPFLLADAFGRKDKKTAWVLYTKAIMAGEPAESISGMIFWKVKSMLSSGRTKPFTENELMNCSRELVSLYHNARSEDGGELSVSLEQFLLKALS